MPPGLRTTPIEKAAILAALALTAVVLVRTAWVCDDAYITFRTVDNLLHGLGPRWNAPERVQAYTHPLWMLVLAAIELVTRRGPYVASVVTSLVCSLSAVSLLALRAARTSWQAVAGVLILTSARSFVDFSTSGLENALSHVLIVLYVLAIARPATTRLSAVPIAIASLLLVNRLDLVWLIGPSLVMSIAAHRSRRAFRALAIGLTPLIAWELFSIVYYGFPVPNTAFAKVRTGIPETELLIQGVRYLQESVRHDPLTLLAIGASVVVALVASRPKTGDDSSETGADLTRALATGQVFYLIYVLWIGGDFMSGRFLTASLLVGALQLVAVPMPPVQQAWRIAIPIGVIGVGLLASTPSLLSGSTFGARAEYVDFHGITDERSYYYPQTGLMRANHAFVPPDLPEAEFARWMISQGQRVATRDTVGMFGYGAATDLFVVDRFGLGDPLLARLPCTRPWRIGHFNRALPDGYIQTLRTGQNEISDPGVAAYYDVLLLITRAPLFSSARWRAIVRMNLGLDEHWLDPYRAAQAR